MNKLFFLAVLVLFFTFILFSVPLSFLCEFIYSSLGVKGLFVNFLLGGIFVIAFNHIACSCLDRVRELIGKYDE